MRFVTWMLVASSAAAVGSGCSSKPNVVVDGPAADAAPGPPGLHFTIPPARTEVGAPILPGVQVVLEDDHGNPVIDGSAAITLAIGANPSSGALLGSAGATMAAGVATFPRLAIDKAGTGYTLVASAPGLPSVESPPFDVIVFPGPCMIAEPLVHHPGLPAQGWSFEALNAAFDYAATPAMTVVATMPSNAGSNFDAVYLLSNGDWGGLPFDSTGHASRVSPTCQLVSQSGNVFDGSDITLAEAADGRLVGPGLPQPAALGPGTATSTFYGGCSSCPIVVQLPSGNIAILDNTAAHELDATTGLKVADLASGTPSVINLAMGPDGAMYVADFVGGAVWRAVPPGAFQRIAANPSTDTIEGMIVLPNGDILLGDLSAQSVVRVSASSGLPVGTITTATIVGGTRSLQLAPNGRVYVAGSTTVYRLDFPLR